MHAGRLFGFLRDYVGFVPGLVVSLVVALLFGGAVGRRLGTSRWLGTALLLSVGLVLAATVTPSREAILFGEQGAGTCGFSRVGLAPLWQLTRVDAVSLNVLLFVPLGLTIALLPPSRGRTGVLIGAFLLPFAVELTQLLVVSLGRICQSADVVDNLTGLAVGLLVGWAARSAWSVWSRRAMSSG
jgi:hypothetical protein